MSNNLSFLTPIIMSGIQGNEGLIEKQGIYYGWIVVAGVFVMTAVTCGAFYSFGVFFLPVMTEFGWSRSVTSGVIAVEGVAYAFTAPLIGLAADKYGYRMVTAITAGILGIGFILGSTVQSVWQMYLFVGLLPGIGACAAIPLPLAMVARWFIKRQGLALGIASAGIGTGAALIPLLTAFMVTEFGWRPAFAVIGILILVSYIPITFFINRIPDAKYVLAYEGDESASTTSNHSEQMNDGMNLTQAIGTSQFWLIFAIFGLCVLCLGLALTHVVPYAIDTGLSPITAATLLTIVGFCSIFGRLTAGFASDRIGAKKVLLFGLILQGLMILWVSKADTLWMFYLFAVFFGVSYGGNLVIIPKLTASTFGAESMGSVYGGISVGDGIGFAIGPILAGYIFDTFGTYNLSFWLVAAGMLLAAGFTIILKERK